MINKYKRNIAEFIKKQLDKTTTGKYVIAWYEVFVKNKYEGRSNSEKFRFFRKRSIQIREGLPQVVAFEPVSTCVLNCEFCLIKSLKTYKLRKSTSMTLI